MRRSAESAFLPAALEIQETPPSPAGRAILWIIMAFFILTLFWAVFSEVDIVSVAQGRIIPSGHSKTVQPLEIGTVSAIHIAEGQAVKAGDVLIELDTSSAQADVDRLGKELPRRSRRSVATNNWPRNWSKTKPGPPRYGRQKMRCSSGSGRSFRTNLPCCNTRKHAR